jgi:Type II CAAX prenyl endopeptidase Rce1-like
MVLPCGVALAQYGVCQRFFVFAHLLNGLSYVSPSFIVANLMLSINWIYARLLTRSLWFCISMHAALDSCSFLIGILLFSGLASLNTIAASLLWLETPFFALVLLVLLAWTLWGKQRINWNDRLTENGDLARQKPSLPEGEVVADTAG